MGGGAAQHGLRREFWAVLLAVAGVVAAAWALALVQASAAGAVGSPSGTIVYSRCGPNINGTPSTTYAVQPDGSGLRPLGAGQHSAVSSTGRVAVYSDANYGTITTFPLAAGSSDPVRHLDTTASKTRAADSLAWSADGTQIAFVNNDAQRHGGYPGRIGVIQDQTGAAPSFYPVQDGNPDDGAINFLDWHGSQWMTFVGTSSFTGTLSEIPAFGSAPSPVGGSDYPGAPANAKFTPTGGIAYRNGNGLTVDGMQYPGARGTGQIADFAISPDEKYAVISYHYAPDANTNTYTLQVVALDGSSRKTLDTQSGFSGSFCGVNWAQTQSVHHVSGTIFSQQCTESACTKSALPNVKVLITGTTSGGDHVSEIALSGADGGWAKDLPPGSYRVGPTTDGTTFADGFDPPTRDVVVGSADVPSQDFTTCASNGAPASDVTARQVRAADPGGAPHCQATIAGLVTDAVGRLGGVEVTISGTTTKGVAVNETVTAASDEVRKGLYNQKVDPGTYKVSIQTAVDSVPVAFKVLDCDGKVLAATGPKPTCQISVSSSEALKNVVKVVNFRSDCVTKVDFKTSMIAEGCFSAMDHKGIKFRAKGRFRMNGIDLQSSDDHVDPVVLDTKQKKVDGNLVKFSLSAQGFGSGWLAWLPQHGLHLRFTGAETSWGFALQTPWGSWGNVGAIAVRTGAGYVTPPKDGSLTLFGLPPVHAPYVRLQMRPGTSTLAMQISWPPLTNHYGDAILPYLDHNGIWKAKGKKGSVSTVYPNIAAVRVEAENSAGVSAIEIRGGPADAYLFPRTGFVPVAHKGPPPKEPSGPYRAVGDGTAAGSIELAQMRARWDLGRGFRLEGALVLHAVGQDRLDKLVKGFGGFLGQKVVILGVDLAWRKLLGVSVLIPTKLDGEVKQLHIPITEPPLLFWERFGLSGTFDFLDRTPRLSLAARARFTLLPTFKHDFLFFQEAAALDIGGGIELSPVLGLDGSMSLLVADSHLIDGTGSVNGITGTQLSGVGGIDFTQLRFPIDIKTAGTGSFSAPWNGTFRMEFHGAAHLFGKNVYHADVLLSDHDAGACLQLFSHVYGFYLDNSGRWRSGGCDTAVFGSAQQAGAHANVPDSLGDKGARDPGRAGASRRGAVQAAAAPGAQVPTFVVSSSSHLAAVAVRGLGGPPKVQLNGPGGLTALIPAGQALFSAPQVTMIENSSDATTYIYLTNPQPGTYTLTPLPGSSAVRALDFARPLPTPSVHASLARMGCERRLTWRVRTLPGQRVSFDEVGSAGRRPLTSTSAGTGSFTFSPGRGNDRRRAIVASVEQQGTPRGSFALVRYNVPTGLPPERVGKVKLSHARGQLRVSWSPVCAASGYTITVAQRKTIRQADIKGTRITIGIGGGGAFSVTVRAYGFNGILGPAASARVS